MDIGRVDASGAVSIFLEAGLRSGDLAFGPGGEWGGNLYLSDFSGIRTVDPEGNLSAPLLTFREISMQWSSRRKDHSAKTCMLQAWDAEGTAHVFRVRPDGSYDIFASGFEQPNTPSWPDQAFLVDVLEFSPDGNVLYVSSSYGNKIYAITPSRIVTGIDFGNRSRATNLRQSLRISRRDSPVLPPPTPLSANCSAIPPLQPTPMATPWSTT